MIQVEKISNEHQERHFNFKRNNNTQDDSDFSEVFKRELRREQHETNHRTDSTSAQDLTEFLKNGNQEEPT